MYWTDCGRQAKIESANYDGSDRQQIVTTGLKSPIAIAVDAQSQSFDDSDN